MRWKIASKMGGLASLAVLVVLGFGQPVRAQTPHTPPTLGTAAPTKNGAVKGTVRVHLCCTDRNQTAVLSQLGLLPRAAMGDRVAGAKVTIAGRTATTDSQGNYSIGNVPPGIHQVKVVHSIYAQVDPWAPKPIPTVNVMPGRAATQSLTVHAPYASVSGKILDATTSKPVLHPLPNGAPTAAYVYVPDNAGVFGDVFDRVDFDAKTFQISVLAGTHQVKAMVPGYQPFSISFNATAGQTVTQDLHLTPLPAKLFGSVKDLANATPVANATLTFGTRTVKTNSQGQYTMAGLPPNQHISMKVTKAGYDKTIAPTRLAPGQERQKDFVIVSPSSVTDADVYGTVKDKVTHQPLAGVAVEVNGRRACTDGAGHYRLLGGGVGASGTPYAIKFVRDRYRTEQLSGTLHRDTSSSGYTGVNRRDIDLAPTASNRIYRNGCVAPPSSADPAGSHIQRIRFVVTDQDTGRPVPNVVIRGTQVTHRAIPLHECTNAHGVATFADVSMAVGGESGQLISGLSFARKGYATHTESSFYAKHGEREVIVVMRPDANQQTSFSCSK